MKSGAALNRHHSKQDYQTPADFMSAVVKRFGGKMDFDLAASKSNAQAARFYSEKDNSLQQDWSKLKGNLWLNPPFNDIGPWASKCAYHCNWRGNIRIFFLTPASIGSNWFSEHVHDKALVLALNGRLHFDPNNPTWGYPKDCILSCYGLSRIGFEVWRWK